MNERELLDYLKNYINSGAYKYEAPCIGKVEVEMIIKALEKQTPTMVKDITRVKDANEELKEVIGICPCCGEIVDEISQAFVCDCGYEADRDYNAALNIKDCGTRLLAW